MSREISKVASEVVVGDKIVEKNGKVFEVVSVRKSAGFAGVNYPNFVYGFSDKSSMRVPACAKVCVRSES